MVHKEIVQLSECGFAIVIIGIDDDKRLFHNAAAAQNCLAGAPGLCAAFRHGEASGQVAEFLINIFHLDLLGNTVTDHLTELSFNILADNENHFIKARLLGIIDRIIHDHFAAGAHFCKLLDAFAKARANARRHDYKCSVHSKTHPPILLGHIRPSAAALCSIFVPLDSFYYNPDLYFSSSNMDFFTAGPDIPAPKPAAAAHIGNSISANGAV